jgi:hypothetical protein
LWWASTPTLEDIIQHSHRVFVLIVLVCVCQPQWSSLGSRCNPFIWLSFCSYTSTSLWCMITLAWFLFCPMACHEWGTLYWWWLITSPAHD